MNLEDLKTKLPYKWKIQSFNNREKKLATKASCVAYIDARDVMDVLDKVCGPENWQDKYEFVGTKLIAGVGIATDRTDSGNGHFREWVWKYDTGTESDYEAEKGQFSDAFKRAAVKWGVGRFLYDLEIKWVDVKEGNPVDQNGKRIYNLTEHFTLPGKSNPATAPSVPAGTSKASQSTQVSFTTQDGTFRTAICGACGSHMYYNEGTAKTGKHYTNLKCESNPEHIIWYPKLPVNDVPDKVIEDEVNKAIEDISDLPF